MSRKREIIFSPNSFPATWIYFVRLTNATRGLRYIYFLCAYTYYYFFFHRKRLYCAFDGTTVHVLLLHVSSVSTHAVRPWSRLEVPYTIDSRGTLYVRTVLPDPGAEADTRACHDRLPMLGAELSRPLRLQKDVINICENENALKQNKKPVASVRVYLYPCDTVNISKTRRRKATKKRRRNARRSYDIIYYLFRK